MSPASDALRSTLDTLQLDPKVKEDRHYLVTLLRRLGYTEEEIVRELGPEPGDEEPLTEVQEEPTEDHGRVIEVEYEGTGEVEEFQPVVRVAHPRDTFTVENQAAGTFEPVTEPVLEPVLEPDTLAEGTFTEEPAEEPEEILDFAEIQAPVGKRMRLKVLQADSPEAAEEAARQAGLHVVRAVPVHVHSHDGSGDHDLRSAEEYSWEQAPAPQEPPQPFAQTPPQTAPPEPVPEAPQTAAEDEAAWEDVEEDWEAADDWGEVDEAPAGAFRYQGYTLYTREVQLNSDRRQRIYFFAKGEPASGEPSAMPEGYEVRENEKTGLPYLARQKGDQE